MPQIQVPAYRFQDDPSRKGEFITRAGALKRNKAAAKEANKGEIGRQL
jgi:hypothetical protein